MKDETKVTEITEVTDRQEDFDGVIWALIGYLAGYDDRHDFVD